MNSELLKAIMVLNKDNIKSLAEYLNMSRQTLSLKIDGISDFKLNEIVQICKRYYLSEQQLLTIFFNEVNWDENSRSGQSNGCESTVRENRFTNQVTPLWRCG